VVYRYIEYYNILERICDNLQLCCREISARTKSAPCASPPRRLEVAELCKIKICDVVNLSSETKRHRERLFGLSENSNSFDSFNLSSIVLDGLKKMLTLDQYATIRRNLELTILDYSVDSQKISRRALPQQGDVRKISLSGTEATTITPTTSDLSLCHR
jgi:hypothetical protein